MQAQKQIHASQLWQQGLNDVTLKPCDTIVLKTLPLVVRCKIFRWWVRKHQIISTKKFACLILALWRDTSPYSVQIRENTDQKNSDYGYFSPSVL